MGDCNFGINFTSPETREKYCKYSYTSWCSTCEKISPRRRSRSETNEACRKKCKEMKTLTPKKYNKCNEYENMELEYDYKGWHETKYDCCRVRSNLVELPTTYISNNCQNLTKNDSDYVKAVKSYEHNSFKFVDFKSCTENFEGMENTKILEKFSQSPKKVSNFVATNTKTCREQIFYFDNHVELQNSNGADYPQKSTNCKEFCALSAFKHHDIPNRKPLCFDTDTYFDRPTDREKYSKEVAYLREKLKILRNAAYTNLDRGNGDTLKDSFVTTSLEIKPKIGKNERYVAPGPVLKSSKSKISLKTRKNNLNKVKKSKSKGVNTVSSDNTESDGSGSESDTVEDDTLDEDPESTTSETISTDESTRDSSDTTTLSIGLSDTGSGETVTWPVRPSLFPNIPPYIKFRSHDLKTPYKVPAGRKYFKWKLSTITPIIVRKTLTNSGLALVRSEFSRESNQWLGTWGKHMKSPMFKTLKDTHKLNHFPGTFQLGRKDRLWRNFQKMISKFGLKEFGFLPHTYVLPQELKILKQNWEFKNGTGKEMWIIKPPASARGVGIKVINKWSQLPKKTSLVVQKYVNNPYLINGSKFDLRLYVLVTSFHPLRVYLYPDGLARFASAKYSDDVKDLKDRYMHLTNYSINKLSSQYTANEDANACHGHKWTLSKLMEYLRSDGVDTKTMWKNLQQLVIKTIISSESLITPLCEENMNSYYNCYELFGIDVLLDEYLKPWLLEVNISPSLHSASPLDAHVKGPLVQTLFDMAQFHFPSRLSQNIRNTPQCFDPRVYTRTLTKKEHLKHIHFREFENRDDYIYDILKDLTGDDVRQLTRAEDEYVVRGKFEKIFPTAHSHKYLEFMEPRYYNRLFDAWETKYASRREDGVALLQTLCAQKIHLKVGSQSILNKSCQSTIPGVAVTSLFPSTEGQSRPLEDIMQETSISNKVSMSNECKV